MNGEPAFWRCRVVAAPPDWPALQVLAVAHPGAPGHAHGRDAARRRVRQLLLQHAGPAIAAPFLATDGSASGACRASVSHEQGFSLLAWCEQGCIGIDVVGPRSLAGANPEELAITARLYLGADPAEGAARTATPQAASQRFASAWARHEAKLKCLGLVLEEGSAALWVRLADCRTARVALPPSLGCDAAASTAWIAWRGDAEGVSVPVATTGR